jgi:hypothetical protein
MRSQWALMSGCWVTSVTRTSWGAGVALLGCVVVVSAGEGKADYFVPGGETGGYFLAVGIGAQSVAAVPEVRWYPAERGQEPAAPHRVR